MTRSLLAADYDGTLAQDGRVDPETKAALERFKAAGGTVAIVTGREVEGLRLVFPDLGDVIDVVVAENGGVLFDPHGEEQIALAPPPPSRLIERLGERRVEPLSVGRVVVATERPHDETARQVILEERLDLSILLNKRAVMILPSGVNKATGLRQALARLGRPDTEIVAIGDAENDLELFQAATSTVAVANAVPQLRDAADWVTEGERGAGVAELIDALLAGRWA